MKTEGKSENKVYWKLNLEEHIGNNPNMKNFYASIVDGDIKYLFKDYKINLFCERDFFIKKCMEQFDNKYEIDRVNSNQKYVKKQAESIIDLEIFIDAKNHEDANIFSKQIDIVGDLRSKKNVRDQYEKTTMLVLDHLPQVLLNIGFRGKCITLETKKYYKLLHEHSKEVDEVILKQLPDAIDNPLAIIKSRIVDNAVVLLTNLEDKTHNKIIVPIQLQNNSPIMDIMGIERVEPIKISSAYSLNKKNKSRGKELFLAALEYKEIIYMNKKLPFYNTLLFLSPKVSDYRDDEYYDFNNKESKKFYQIKN